MWLDVGKELIRLMSEKDKNPSDSTVLHLDKFAAGVRLPDQTVAEPGITVMIKRASAETAQQSATPIVVPKEGGALPATDFLGAVSYCYAKGVFESDEIERKMSRDATLRESVHGQTPSASGIRRFRCMNKAAIEQTLEKAFGFMRRKEKADMMKPLSGQPAIPPVAPTLGDSTVCYLKHEAEDRVQQAAFIDNMSKD